MTGRLFRIAGLTLGILLGHTPYVSAAQDVDLQIVSYPEQVAKFSDFYVRVRLKNIGQTPLRGCDGSEDKCLAMAWSFVDRPGPIVVPRNNVFPIPPFVDDFLRPGETMETNLRIPTGGWGKPQAVISVAAIVKQGASLAFEERRLKVNVRSAPRDVLKRRFVMRAIVYGYLSLTLLALGYMFIVRRQTA
ncbi:MAG TPA: hypothetical protein VIB79_26230 [Candidatus Binatia bacterium]